MEHDLHTFHSGATRDHRCSRSGRTQPLQERWQLPSEHVVDADDVMPVARKASARWLPRKPATPETKTRCAFTESPQLREAGTRYCYDDPVSSLPAGNAIQSDIGL